jgi:hypothetical protein
MHVSISVAIRANNQTSGHTQLQETVYELSYFINADPPGSLHWLMHVQQFEKENLLLQLITYVRTNPIRGQHANEPLMIL